MPKQAAVEIELDKFQKMSRAKVGSVAHLYDLAPRSLSLECLKGNVPGSVKKKGTWWVSPAGMEQFFTASSKRKR